MAAPTTVTPQVELEDKLIKQSIGSQEFLKRRYEMALEAEVMHNLKPVFLSSILNYLLARLSSRLTKGTITQQVYDTYLVHWKELDTRFGVLTDRRYYSNMELEEWQERFRVLDELIDLVGMGTTDPDGITELPQPMAMWQYHECPEDCPHLVKMRNERQRYE